MVFLNEGAFYLLQQQYGIDTGYGTYMYAGLFTNNFTPVPSTPLTGFTVATGSGMGFITMDEGLFTVPTVFSDHYVMYYDPPNYLTWTNGTGVSVTVYGYVVWNGDNSVGLFAERFPSPVVLAPGQSLRVQPAFEGGSCPLPTPPPPP